MLNVQSSKDHLRTLPVDLDGKSVLLVHPTGNANVRQAALALFQAGILAGFHTTITWRPEAAINGLLPGNIRAELARRSFSGIPAELMHAHPWHEIVRLFAGRMKWRSLTRHETGPFSTDAICAALDRAVGSRLATAAAPSAVYAYDDCAEQTFAAAKQRGARCIYELPIAYLRAWRSLRDEEIGLEPLWGQTIAAAADSELKLARKDAEIRAADEVFVPSSFVARTLQKSPARKVTIVPYGCPSLDPVDMQSENSRVGRRPAALRVLYVGSMSQRKGISYLLRAMELLGVDAELRLVGRLTHSSPELAAELNRYDWTPSMPHSEVLKTIRESDVLVLPTLFEGRALVVLESLSRGVPVITTANSGTEDVVLNGETGFIVPIRSAEAIAERLTQLAEDRTLLARMSAAALRKAAECTWEQYRAQWIAAISATLRG